MNQYDDKPEYQQGSQEWLHWRRSKIGASDSAACLDICPYKSRYQLWQEKVGMYTPETNQAMRYGTENEEKARQEFCRLTNFVMTPCVKEHPTIPYMAASLDGITPDGEFILEIKCNGEKNHDSAKFDVVPPNHYAQIQHQLEVCGLKTAYYFSYVPGDSIVVVVKRDQEFIEKLLVAEKEFWGYVQDFVPPPLSKRDYTFRSDAQWEMIANDWKNTVKKLKGCQDEEKRLRDILISMSDDKSSMGAGIKLSKRTRRGSIDYDKIPELENVDFDRYRKPSIDYWNIAEG
jgi:putative phage-type endonuclease